jgi:uncharacterized protein
MIRVVLDTNVIVSALIFGGIPRSVLELAQSERCDWWYSDPVQDEVERVLRVKFGWPQEKLNEILPRLWKIGTFIRPDIRIHSIIDDPDDDRVLECAAPVEQNSSFLEIVISSRWAVTKQYPSFLRVSSLRWLGWTYRHPHSPAANGSPI